MFIYDITCTTAVLIDRVRQPELKFVLSRTKKKHPACKIFTRYTYMIDDTKNNYIG